MIANWVLTYALYSSILLGLAWICSRLVPDHWHTVREAVWKSAIVMAFVSATLGSFGVLDSFGRFGTVDASTAPGCGADAVVGSEFHRNAPPTELRPGALRIRSDHVIEDMVHRLGAEVTALEAPFQPEGGAYGHGRVHDHEHGHGHHDHEHHDHGHPQDGAHGHGHHHGHQDPPDRTHDRRTLPDRKPHAH